MAIGKKIDETFIKYMFRDNIVKSDARALSINHNDINYMFSLERLTFRKFKGTDYKKNNDRRIYNNPCYRIAFVPEGECDIYVDNVITRVDSSIIFLQSPGKKISITPKTDNPCSVYELFFELFDTDNNPLELKISEYFSSIVGDNIKIKSEINKIQPTTSQDLKNLFETLYTQLNYDLYQFKPKSNIIILDIISLIIKNIEETEKHIIDTLDPLDNVVKYLTINYKKDHTVDELAQLASLSKHYFQAAFKQRFNFTPIDYVNRLRIKHAKFMLKNYNYSCKEISNNIGFHNPLYFSNVFKKYVGISPMSYRAQNKNIF